MRRPKMNTQGRPDFFGRPCKFFSKRGEDFVIPIKRFDRSDKPAGPAGTLRDD